MFLESAIKHIIYPFNQRLTIAPYLFPTGIGVPIMLAYVYGVVPISLCRGGGCGVSRGKGRGVRIDFDDEGGPITGKKRWLIKCIIRKKKLGSADYCIEPSLWHLLSVVADAWRALKSPSLGESSLEGGASGLSTTSPSEGLSVAPGGLGDTPHFNTLAGGALGARTGKYSRYEGMWDVSRRAYRVILYTVW